MSEPSSSDLVARKGLFGRRFARLIDFFVLSFPARILIVSILAFVVSTVVIVRAVTRESAFVSAFEPWLHTVAILAQRDFEMTMVAKGLTGHSNSFISDYSLPARIVRFEVTNLDHVVSISTDPAAIGRPTRMVPPEVAERALESSQSVALEDRPHHRAMVHPARVRQACLACHKGGVGAVVGYVYTEFDTSGAGALVLHSLLETGQSVAIVLLLVGLALAVYFLRGYVRPAQRLARHMHHMADGPDLEPVDPTGLSPEFREIAEGYNRGVQRLNAARSKVDKLEQERLIDIERLATIGRMSAMMAHEIRNPLAGISGAVRILAQEVPLDQEQRAIVNEMMRQTQRLSTTLTELLSRAKPRGEAPTNLDPRSLVERVAGLLRPGLAHRSVTIATEADPSCDRVYADEEWLVQILLNLIMNAEQAMVGGGAITARVRPSEVRPEYVSLEITDDGPGMPPDVRVKALEPFFTTKADGTGLGLTISRELTERMGGVLELESAEGAGTSVRIHLPIEPPFLPEAAAGVASREPQP